jgi:glycosyltransferase involved in cell wall biosynthesis
MTRVAHLITADRLAGGMEHFLARLAPPLTRAGLEQLIITRQGPELAAAFRAAGIPVAQYALRKRNPISWWGVRQTLRRFRPDVVMSWLPRAAQRVPPGPWVHAAHIGWYRGLDCYESVERVVVPQPDMVRHYRELGFAGEITVLPYFAQSRQLPPVARDAFGTPPEAPVVLGMGRFDHTKGFDLALTALAALPRVILWLAGEGEEEPALRRLAAELGVADRVRFLGWRSDTSALLSRASAMVMPSRWQEALGLVVLEAWEAGTPVVSTDTPGPRYLIRDHDAGLLVPIDDAAALAAALGRVLDEPALAARLVANGRARFQSSFTEAAGTAAYFDYFTRVAREAQRGADV